MQEINKKFTYKIITLQICKPGFYHLYGFFTQISQLVAYIESSE